MLGPVTVKWVDKQQYVGIDGSKHSVVMSTHDDENNVGVSPLQLVLIALGGCTSVDVVGILQKKRQKLTGLEVEVSAQRNGEHPRYLTKIYVTYRLTGRGLNEKAVRDAIELSEGKYCSVSESLRGKAEIVNNYEIIEEE